MSIRFVSELSGSYPLDVCVVTEPGKVWPNQCVTEIDGWVNSDLEVEALSTWPDGSISLARVCGPFQHTQAVSFKLDVVVAPPSPAPKFAIDVNRLWNSLGCWMEVTDAAGQKWRREGTPEDGNEILKVVTNAAGPSRRREHAIVADLLSPTGQAHPRLRIQTRWVFYSRHGGWRFEVVLENCRADLPPVAVPIQGFEIGTIALDGTKTALWKHTACIIHPGKRGIFAFDLGLPTPQPRVLPDVATWAKLGICLPYDTAAPVPESAGVTLLASIKKDKERMTTLPMWLDGAAMHHYPLFPAMGATGDRYEIGDWPLWAAYSINGDGVACRAVTRAADINGSAAFSIHWRDPGADWLGVQHNHAIWKSGAGYPNDPNAKNPAQANVAHLPNLGAWTWLTHGRTAAAEELACWALQGVRDNWPADGTLQNLGQRREAWAMRQIALACTFLPDQHPQRAYLRSCIDRTRTKWTTAPLTHPLGSFGGIFAGSGSNTLIFTKYESAWMAAWFTSEVCKLERLLGAHPGSTRLIDHNWKFWRAYVTAQGTNWTAPDGTIVPWNPDVLVAYHVPIGTFRPIFNNGVKEVPGSAQDITSFAAMRWWERISEDWNFAAPTAADIPADNDPTHARPVLRDAGGKIILPRVSTTWTAVKGSQWHEYGPGRCALHRWAVARGLPDAVAMAADLETRLDAHFTAHPAPAGIRTVPVL